MDSVLYVRKNINQFNTKSDKHDRNLRNGHELDVPPFRLSKVKNSFRGQCIRLYNKIPERVQNLSIKKFKKVVKERLCGKGYYKIADYMSDTTPWE